MRSKTARIAARRLDHLEGNGVDWNAPRSAAGAPAERPFRVLSMGAACLRRFWQDARRPPIPVAAHLAGVGVLALSGRIRWVAALLAVAAMLGAFGSPAFAQTVVPAGWGLKPNGLTAGDQFRLLFLSSTTRDASSTAIADYNTFIQNLAAAGHADIQDYSAGFRVVGCTENTDARHNTSTTGTGVPIYWLDGAKVADDYADFYDGSWDDEANDKNESGTDGPDTSLLDSHPFTGCVHDGTEAKVGFQSHALGTSGIFGSRLGRPNGPDSGDGPLSSSFSSSTDRTAPCTGSLRSSRWPLPSTTPRRRSPPTPRSAAWPRTRPQARTSAPS